MPRPAPSQELKERIAQLYESGLSCQQLSTQVGYTEAGCRKILNKMGIKLRSRGCRDYPQYRTYQLNAKYFDVIDTQEKAYWLGFICAAGTISTNGKGFSLFVKPLHKAHIEKFKAAIGATHPLAYRYNRHTKQEEHDELAESTGVVERVGLSLSSVELVRVLAKHGISNNRLNKCKTPRMDIELKRHFWRGMFDGDGRLFKHKNLYKKTIEFRLKAPKNLIKSFCYWAKNFTKVPVKVRRSRVFGARYVAKTSRKHDVSNILKQLYRGASVYMPNKLHMAVEHKAIIGVKTPLLLTVKG